MGDLNPKVASDGRGTSHFQCPFLHLLILSAVFHTFLKLRADLKSGNACYHLVQNLLSSRLLSKNLNIKIYRTIILPVVLYECETLSLTLRRKGS